MRERIKWVREWEKRNKENTSMYLWERRKGIDRRKHREGKKKECEREREEKNRIKQREGEKKRMRKRERVCVCVCEKMRR